MTKPTWTETPPTEPGRYWKSTAHSCGKCWRPPRIAHLILGYSEEREIREDLGYAGTTFKLQARKDTRWGPKLYDEPAPARPEGA